MTHAANPLRGEADLILADKRVRLRPTFSALVQAEAEVGSLGTMLERAARGDVRLADVSALFWACAAESWIGGDRATFEDALVDVGIAQLLPVYRSLLAQAFSGR